jgi:hypothetical protein
MIKLKSLEKKLSPMVCDPGTHPKDIGLRKVERRLRCYDTENICQLARNMTQWKIAHEHFGPRKRPARVGCVFAGIDIVIVAYHDTLNMKAQKFDRIQVWSSTAFRGKYGMPLTLGGPVVPLV